MWLNILNSKYDKYKESNIGYIRLKFLKIKNKYIILKEFRERVYIFKEVIIILRIGFLVEIMIFRK